MPNHHAWRLLARIRPHAKRHLHARKPGALPGTLVRRRPMRVLPHDSNNPHDPATLFPLPPPASPEPRVHRLQVPMWTAHKARFIERYLYYFVLVTKHGTYIDGFAGPQQPDDTEMWTAKRVLESEPRWQGGLFIKPRKKDAPCIISFMRRTILRRPCLWLVLIPTPRYRRKPLNNCNWSLVSLGSVKVGSV